MRNKVVTIATELSIYMKTRNFDLSFNQAMTTLGQ